MKYSVVLILLHLAFFCNSVLQAQSINLNVFDSEDVPYFIFEKENNGKKEKSYYKNNCNGKYNNASSNSSTAQMPSAP